MIASLKFFILSLFAKKVDFSTLHDEPYIAAEPPAPTPVPTPAPTKKPRKPRAKAIKHTK